MAKLKQWLLPVPVLLLLFLLDGTITATFYDQLFINPGLMFPRLLFIGLVYYAFRLPVKQVVVYAGIFGLLQDSYYVGILGIYLTAYIITTYLASIIKKQMDINVLTIGLALIILLAVFELIVYMIYFVIGYAQLSVSEFIVLRYAPTLLFNIFAYFISYYLLKVSANEALR